MRVMAMCLRPLAMLAFAVGLGAPAAATAQDAPIPKLTARVTDTTGTLTDSERGALESKLAALEQDKGSQVAVLLVPSTGDETIEQYGIRVGEAWKLGRGKVDDGAILIVAKNDRKMRIEVGYGLEGAIPDAVAKRVVADVITPYFRQGDYYTGIAAGVDALIAVISGEPLPEPSRNRSHRAGNVEMPRLIGAVILGVIVGFVVRGITNRFFGAGSALLTSGITGLLLAGAGLAMMAAAFAFFIVIGGLGGGGRGRGGGFWVGGLGGGGGFGSGGGGFSGGGGGFGGGGASGGW